MEESLFPFVNRTAYDQRALVALNRLAEASVRKEKSRRTRALCYVCGVAGLVAGAFVYRYQAIVGQLLLLYGVLLLLVAISWRSFQLRSSRRQLQRGVTDCRYEFDEDEMLCHTAAGTERYPYDRIYAVVADSEWYAIFLDESHGVILDKQGFSTGDPLSFKSFIGMHTKLPIQEL